MSRQWWPDYVEIGGHRWRVFVSKRRPAWVAPKDAIGYCVPSAKMIWSSGKQPTIDEVKSTLAHELLHAVFPSGYFDERLEEAIVTLAESAFYSLLSNNDLSFFHHSSEVDDEGDES